uniref:Alkylated DNA repair protein AlkB homologue 8 N-terminal domain-containing protein n=1 Tax=Knipowitschia caucasica TaxID=637954 RepID=A0AAV2JFG7_KNICA
MKRWRTRLELSEDCEKKAHFPCAQKEEFVSQFICPFPSFCPAHAPVQTLSPALDLSLPHSCSVCLDVLDPVLSFSVFKCPECHSSWLHRHCAQLQAHSSGLFFFRCTLCNNKDQFQEEMLRMGIYIPERKKAHFPCAQKEEFVSQFICPFPSFCPAHAPVQTLSPALDLSLPHSCSVCLDVLDPVLSFSVFKCPECHSSWLHRHCAQLQAHSSGLFFFRCTLCNNKDQFQEEMLRMGIYIPESHDSVKLIKFADDTTLIGLISNNDESAYRREVDRLVSWCSGNNLELNAQKTVEMIVDFRKSTVPPPPPSVMDSPITSVESFRFLGTTITQDLKWEPTISSLIKKAQQRMYFLRQLRKAKLPAQMLVQFYTAIIESILTSSITVWFAGATVRDKQRLQRIVRSAEEVIGRSLPSLQDLFTDEETPFPISPGADAALRQFLRLLLSQIQCCAVFEGPEDCKNLALDAQGSDNGTKAGTRTMRF